MDVGRNSCAWEEQGNGVQEKFDNMAIPRVRNCQIWRNAINPIVTANDFILKCEISAIILTRSIYSYNEKIRWLRLEILKYEAE